MSETASGRYHIDLAPGGLVLVHELLNTVSAGRPREADLLSARELAQPWLRTAVSLWAAGTGAATPFQVELGERDLIRLRALRDQLRALAGDASDVTVPGLAGSIQLTLTEAGEIATHPRGRGAGWVSSAALGEIYLAQQHNLWDRLKICRNHRCGTAFYDRSRNNSGVWHDVHVCGNAANLRASRARRKRAVQDLTPAPESAR